MHNLKPITPLGGDTCRIHDFDGLKVVERTNFALASVALRHNHTPAAIQAFLETPLPTPGKWVAHAHLNAMWIGPDQWLVQAPYDTHELLATQIKMAVGDSASVTEQTDGWCQFEVSGSCCADVFERLCNIDIRAMSRGDVTRTLLHHLGCFVRCENTSDRFCVIGPRSSAESLLHALIASAKSVI